MAKRLLLIALAGVMLGLFGCGDKTDPNDASMQPKAATAGEGGRPEGGGTAGTATATPQ